MSRAPARRPVRWHRYGLMCVLALGVGTVVLLAPDGRGSRAAVLLAAGATLLAAVVTSEATPRLRRAAGVSLGVALGAAGAVMLAEAPAPALVSAVTALLLATTIAVIAGGLVRLVLERGVVLQAVLGAIAVYVLLGLVFAFLIGAIATGSSGPYFAEQTDGTQSDRAYFSFASLTTTGFGDLTAGTRLGRTLAVLETLVGQLYLVTVIATLVGNLRGRGPSGPASGYESRMIERDELQTTETACPDCAGTGRRDDGPCETCQGSGRVMTGGDIET